MNKTQCFRTASCPGGSSIFLFSVRRDLLAALSPWRLPFQSNSEQILLRENVERFVVFQKYGWESFQQHRIRRKSGDIIHAIKRTFAPCLRYGQCVYSVKQRLEITLTFDFLVLWLVPRITQSEYHDSLFMNSRCDVEKIFHSSDDVVSKTNV
jgi:hypothetical protein